MGKDRDLINIKVSNYCDIIQHRNYAFTKRDIYSNNLYYRDYNTIFINLIIE